MSKYVNIKNIVQDFINDRLTESDRSEFLKTYASTVTENRSEANVIFDMIQDQVDGLSEQELAVFFTKIDAVNAPERSPKVLWLHKVLPLMKYAAVLVVLLGLAFVFFNASFFKSTSDSYHAQADELIWLSDSSSVLLKKGSTLVVSSSYGQQERQLTLAGEGFFTVKPNKQKPFIVHASNGFYTRVLGTSFLMSSKNDHDKVQVKTGKVQVGNLDEVYTILLPGDQLTKNFKEEFVVIRNPESLPEIIEFNNLDLRTIAAKLMERYHQKIVIDESVPQGLKYTATFSSSQSLDEIIMTISALHRLSYQITPQAIIVSKK